MSLKQSCKCRAVETIAFLEDCQRKIVAECRRRAGLIQCSIRGQDGSIRLLDEWIAPVPAPPAPIAPVPAPPATQQEALKAKIRGFKGLPPAPFPTANVGEQR